MTEQEEIEYNKNIIRLAQEAEDGNVIKVPRHDSEEEFFKWLETAEVKNT